jgi:hypothetical protein
VRQRGWRCPRRAAQPARKAPPARVSPTPRSDGHPPFPRGVGTSLIIVGVVRQGRGHVGPCRSDRRTGNGWARCARVLGGKSLGLEPVRKASRTVTACFSFPGAPGRGGDVHDVVPALLVLHRSDAVDLVVRVRRPFVVARGSRPPCDQPRKPAPIVRPPRSPWLARRRCSPATCPPRPSCHPWRPPLPFDKRYDATTIGCRGAAARIECHRCGHSTLCRRGALPGGDRRIVGGREMSM